MDLGGVRDGAVDPLVPAGREIVAATDAAVLFDADEVPAARAALLAAVGDAGTVRVMAAAGNYQMMNRVLDGVGNPVAAGLASIAAELGVAYPPSGRAGPSG